MSSASTTSDLTHDELVHVLPIVKLGMKYHIGKENSVTNSHIRENLKNKYGIEITSARMRKIFQHLRMKKRMEFPGYMLIASQKGYWLTNDKEEINDWIGSVEGRICVQSKLVDVAKEHVQTL